jgi:hypothetical protein
MLGPVQIQSCNENRRRDDDNAKNRKRPNPNAMFSLGHNASPFSPSPLATTVAQKAYHRENSGNRRFCPQLDKLFEKFIYDSNKL